jgi:cholesterol transport system auxiliary component
MNRLPITLSIVAIFLLTGCASAGKEGAGATYDFGAAAAPIATAKAPLAALVVAEASGAALDTERMAYRLAYADPLQTRAYANSRWSASPLQLLTQRFKTRLSQAGVKVLSASDATSGVPLLRIEVEDFSQRFDSGTESYGQVVLRASLFDGRSLIDQRSLRGQTRAAGADAGGGAAALVATTDTLADELITWLATLEPRKK